MDRYLNLGNADFQLIRRDLYVDKGNFIINRVKNMSVSLKNIGSSENDLYSLKNRRRS